MIMIENNKRVIPTIKGVSLLEIIITISVLLMLGSISVSVFSDLSNSTSLDKDANIIASYIDRARGEAIDSVFSVPHGVYLESDKISIFSGTTYSIGDLESYYDVSSKSSISSIDLTGGVTSFYFEKLTGIPSATGTITVSSDDGSRLITIYGTGVVDVE